MMFHLWGNTNTNLVRNGSAQQNGVTKFKDVSTKALKYALITTGIGAIIVLMATLVAEPPAFVDAIVV